MPKYKFQFQTGHIYDGSIEFEVKNFIAVIDGEISRSLAMVIEAHGGQLIPEKPKAKRKTKPVKWDHETNPPVLGKTRELLDQMNEVTDDSSST